MKTGERNKIIFSALASLQRVRNYILDILGLFGVVYSVLSFNENPFFFSCVLTFLIAAILLSGYNKVLVFKGEIVFKVQHPIDFFSKEWRFVFEEIESINADLRLSKRRFILSEIGSVIFPASSFWNTVTIKKKDDSIAIINTKVDKEGLEKALSEVGQLTNGKVPIIFL